MVKLFSVAEAIRVRFPVGTQLMNKNNFIYCIISPVPIGEEPIGSYLLAKSRSLAEEARKRRVNMKQSETLVSMIRRYRRYGTIGNLWPLGIIVLFVLALVVPGMGTEQQYWKWIHYTIPAAFVGMGVSFFWGMSMRRKELALEKNFRWKFSILIAVDPPDHRDWVAMNVIQRVVDDRMQSVKDARKKAFDEEDRLIKDGIRPCEKMVLETIARARGLPSDRRESEAGGRRLMRHSSNCFTSMRH